MGKTYVGDVGTRITLTLGEDASTATVRTIKYEKPNGSVGGWDAELGADNESIYYDTASADDLDQAGTWTLESYVEMPTGKWHGERVRLRVYDPVDDA